MKEEKNFTQLSSAELKIMARDTFLWTAIMVILVLFSKGPNLLLCLASLFLGVCFSMRPHVNQFLGFWLPGGIFGVFAGLCFYMSFDPAPPIEGAKFSVGLGAFIGMAVPYYLNT